MAQAKTLVRTSDLDRDAWLEARREGIGSSDAAAVCGLSPWASPLSVYLDKLHEWPDSEQTEAMECGQLLEDDVAELFYRRTNIKPRRRFAILQHPQYPFMLANLDRTLPELEHGHGPGILECKAAGIQKRSEWADDQAPAHLIVQVQHQLAVTGYRWGYLAVLLGGNTFKYTRLERDEELIADLIRRERAFWSRVKARRPDPAWADGSQSTAQALRVLYPQSDPERSVVLAPEAEQWLQQYRFWKGQKTEAEGRILEAQNRLEAHMAEAEAAYLTGEDRPACTWKTQTSRRLDSKRLQAERPDVARDYLTEQTTRVFRVKGEKN